MDRRGLVHVDDPDLAYPQTRGERPADLAHALDFTAALYRVGARDAEVHELLVEVHHLARPESDLREPGLVDRVRAEMAAASPPTAELATLAA